MLSESEARSLLDNLCVRLGFCLPPEASALIVANPPQSVSAFANAVITAEGLDPTIYDRHIYRQVKAMVAKAFHDSAEG